MAEVCPGCDKELGTGMLLDEFPEPPEPRTSMHSLYLASTMEVADDIETLLSKRDFVIAKEAWIIFASQYRCIVCKHGLEKIDE